MITTIQRSDPNAPNCTELGRSGDLLTVTYMIHGLTSEPFWRVAELTFDWTFGDGQTSSGTYYEYGNEPTHTYAQPGTYPVEVLVTDTEGRWMRASATAVIRVNAAPTVTITRADVQNRSVTLDAQATDPNGDPVELTWDFGDGQALGGASGAVTHEYRDNGAYVVRVTATDPYGGTSSASQTVNIAQRPLGVAINARVDGQTVTFRASGVDPAGGPLTFTWDFGDGASGEGPEVTHRFDALTEIEVILTARTVLGASSYASYMTDLGSQVSVRIAEKLTALLSVRVQGDPTFAPLVFRDQLLAVARDTSLPNPDAVQDRILAGLDVFAGYVNAALADAARLLADLTALLAESTETFSADLQADIAFARQALEARLALYEAGWAREKQLLEEETDALFMRLVDSLFAQIRVAIGGMITEIIGYAEERRETLTIGVLRGCHLLISARNAQEWRDNDGGMGGGSSYEDPALIVPAGFTFHLTYGTLYWSPYYDQFNGNQNVTMRLKYGAATVAEVTGGQHGIRYTDRRAANAPLVSVPSGGRLNVWINVNNMSCGGGVTLQGYLIPSELDADFARLSSKL